MELIVEKDNVALNEAAAKLVKETAERKPEASMVLAMGNTPMGTYKRLAEMKKAGQFDPARLNIFQLDGYLGITSEDPRSLERWLRKSVLEPWEISDHQVVFLKEDGENPEQICRDYVEKVTAAGGFDLAVLGLGPNGHLGFNEPPSVPDLPTRVVPLTPESIESNAGYWGDPEKVPRMSITAGMDILLQSRRVLLLASGEHKRDILYQTVKGPVTDQVPASFLQQHPNVTVIADQAAWPGEVV